MADDLTKALLVEEAAPTRAIAEALFASVTGGVPLLQALVEAGAVSPPVLARYLARTDEPQLQRVVSMQELVDRLPPGLCARLLAVPVRRDPITGTVDIAVADPADTHPAEEIAFHLGSPVRIVRAPVAAIEEGLRRVRMRSIPPAAVASRRAPSELPPSRPEPYIPPGTAPRRRNTPPWGTPTAQKAPSEVPASTSDIPIPLTRRAFEKGGTQRPPPPVGPDAKLGVGYSVAPGAFQPAVEVRGRAAAALDGRNIPRAPSTGGFAALAQQPMPDTGSALASLRVATTRDSILDLVLASARTVALKVGLFVVKKGGFQGWSCTPELGDRATLQSMTIPLESETVFNVAVKEGFYLGPLPNDEAHRRLIGFMRGASRDVALTPIRVSGKTAVVILADGLGDTMIATRRLDEIARTAGDAFARIVRSKR